MLTENVLKEGEGGEGGHLVGQQMPLHALPSLELLEAVADGTDDPAAQIGNAHG